MKKLPYLCETKQIKIIKMKNLNNISTSAYSYEGYEYENTRSWTRMCLG